MKSIFTNYATSDKDRFPSFAQECEAARPSTCFYADLKVAEAFGVSAVKDTLVRCGDLHKRNPYEVTELYLVLNNLMWELADGCYAPDLKSRRGKLYALYQQWYNTIDDIAGSEWPEAAQLHFYSVTD